MAVYQHHLLIFLYFLTLLLIPTNSHNTNITAILDAFPDYSLYNTFLSKTNLSHEINSHNTVTCLVLSNSAMSSLVAHHISLTRIKNALRHLFLLGYFDHKILHNLTHGGGNTLTTTLYHTTGNSSDNQLGFVNITNLRGGRVGFASARPGLAFDAMYVKSVKQVPYNLSVLEISAPTFPGLMDFNLTALLEKAGCKIFASLITASGVLKIYESTMDKGFTLFAPKDIAFKADGAPDLTNLSRTDLVTILQYHALPSYTTKASLKTTREPIATMASSSSGKYNLNLSVTSHGDEISLSTGVSTAQVASTVLDDTPMSVLTVESLLLPSEMLISVPVPTAPSQVALTPTPAPVLSTAPPPQALPEPNRRPPRPRRPPPRPRPPPAPHAHVPPPPHAHSPPSPHADVPPPPSFPDIVLPPDHAPSPDHNDAAGRLIACLASLVTASVCITTVFL